MKKKGSPGSLKQKIKEIEEQESKYTQLSFNMYSSLTVKLLEQIEITAKEAYKGHYTFFKSATCWRGFFGTPGNEMDGALLRVPAFESLNDLLYKMVSTPLLFDYERIVKEIQAEKEAGI